MRSLTAALAAVVLAGTVAGCSMFQRNDPRACPRVSLLDDASRVTLYREGPGRDLTDVIFEARIDDLRSACRYRDRQVRVFAKINILAVRGPAASGGKANFPFFVAVTDSEQNVLNKQVFDSVIEIPEGRRRGGVFEETEQIIQLEEGESGENYEIIVGFQLSGEQLERNRRRRF